MSTIYDPCNPSSKNPGWRPGSESLVVYQTVVTSKISSFRGVGVVSDACVGLAQAHSIKNPCFGSIECSETGGGGGGVGSR